MTLLRSVEPFFGLRWSSILAPEFRVPWRGPLPPSRYLYTPEQFEALESWLKAWDHCYCGYMVFTKASESTRQEYAARMNRVVDHIQKHLDDPLDLEQLAAIACFSPFHFHRLFSAWMGETIQAFVQRLRLERAAAELVFDLRKSITAIALDCGFSGSSAFALPSKKPSVYPPPNGGIVRFVKRVARRVKLKGIKLKEDRNCRV